MKELRLLIQYLGDEGLLLPCLFFLFMILTLVFW